MACDLTPVLRVLPAETAAEVLALTGQQKESLTEIRLRAGRKTRVRGVGWQKTLRAETTAQDCEETLLKCAEYSLYAVEAELRRGSFALPGGARAGFCGRAVTENGKVARIVQPGSFCFRIPREVRGCAAGILPYLVEGERVLSALILSPPGGGKTTLLREIARCLGEEREVGLADERSELAACREGKPTLDVGKGTDVMDGLPKAEAIERMVRAMSPEVLVTDEIGAQEDCAALWNAARCGVALIASAHAGSVREAREKVGLGDLIRKGAFLRLAVLSDVCGPGTLERVEDEKGNCLYEREKGHEKRRYGAGVFDLHFLGPAGGAEDPLPRAHSGGAARGR